MKQVSPKDLIEITIIFSFLTLITLHTQLPKLSQGFIGPKWSDTPQFLWNTWHLERFLKGKTPLYHTEKLFYPTGVDLTFHTLSLGNTIPLAVLFSVFNHLFLFYNILILLSFIMGGIGAYLLAFYYTEDKKASLLAGVLFTFSSYHLSRALIHLNLTSIQWFPFFFLYLKKTIEKKDYKNGALTGLFYSLTVLSSWIYGAYLILLTGLYIVFKLIFKEIKINKLKYALPGVLISTSIILPFAFPLLVHQADYAQGGSGIALDPLDYIIPDKNFEKMAFLGITLPLALLGILRSKNKVLIVIILLFVLLSFGRMGLIYPIVNSIPIFQVSKHASRYAAIVSLLLIPPSSKGASFLLDKTPKKLELLLILMLVPLAIFISYKPTIASLSWNKFTKVTTDPFNGKVESPVLNFPPHWTGLNWGMFYQIYHKEKMYGGSISRTPKEVRKIFKENLFLKQSRALNYSRIIKNKEKYKKSLRSLNFSTIIFKKDLIANKTVRKELGNLFNQTTNRSFLRKNIKIYRK